MEMLRKTDITQKKLGSTVKSAPSVLRFNEYVTEQYTEKVRRMMNDKDQPEYVSCVPFFCKEGVNFM